MKQHPGTLPANVAALGELPPGGRPKAIVWTGERVRAWQKDFDAQVAAARAAGGRVDPIDIWISTPRPSPSWCGPPPRPWSSSTPPAGCAVGRSILVIVWHLVNDPAARHGAAMPGTVITWEG
jgi:hypothetical protein